MTYHLAVGIGMDSLCGGTGPGVSTLSDARFSCFECARRAMAHYLARLDGTTLPTRPAPVGYWPERTEWVYPWEAP